MKNRFLPVIIFCFLVSATLAGQAKNNSYPEDTMQRFIGKYGKDSLITLLNEAISKSEKLIIQYHDELRVEQVAKEINLLGRKFNTGLDTLTFPRVEFDFGVGRLYGLYYGNKTDLVELKKMAEEQVKTNPAEKINEYFLENVHDEKLRIILTMFCEQLPVSAAMYDTIYKMSSAYPVAEKIKLYAFLSEIDRNCSSKLPSVKSLKDSAFVTLYKDFRLSSLMEDTVTVDAEYPYWKNIQYRVKLMAYGLYGGNLTPDQSGRDLMYLLQLQTSDGGWKEYNYKDDNMHYPTIVYATWVMYEYRAYLRKKQQ